MAASDALSELAVRAKTAEDHVKAARKQARSDVQKQVATARENARRTADDLQTESAATAAGVSQWWTEVQQNWSMHVANVRRDVETRKAERDSRKLQHRADTAESDAVAAVAFAEAALEEAEYAVLDATLARMDAEAEQPSV
jgi:hypothetical protein